MKFRKFIIVLLFFLCTVNIWGQNSEYTVHAGTGISMSVIKHQEGIYKWGLFLDDQAIADANPSDFFFSSLNEGITTLIILRAGIYYVLVNETFDSSCSTTRSIKITVLPNNFRIAFLNPTSSSCYQANNDFSIPIQFKDETNGLPLSSSHFPITVSFQVNGVDQPTQSITFANQNLAISGSSFSAGPNSDTQVEITITGATDTNNLTIQPETTSGQNIHTHTIFRDLTAPTVLSMITNNVTPTVSGTATVGSNETFSVSVNGTTYVPGDGNLVLSVTGWTLTIPVASALPEGTYDVVAAVSNAR